MGVSQFLIGIPKRDVLDGVAGAVLAAVATGLQSNWTKFGRVLKVKYVRSATCPWQPEACHQSRVEQLPRGQHQGCQPRLQALLGEGHCCLTRLNY